MKTIATLDPHTDLARLRLLFLMREADARGFRWLYSQSHKTDSSWADVGKPFQDAQMLCQWAGKTAHWATWDLGTALISLRHCDNDKQLQIDIASSSCSIGEALMAEIKARTAALSLKVKDTTRPVQFWYAAGGGEWHSSQRNLAVTPWPAIRQNYAIRTQQNLETLMAKPYGLEAGHLILWTGISGTGKTFALRTLIYEWRDWCHFSYITDPEIFFGQASYMMEVALESEPEEDIEESEELSEPWRLLIIEDADELVSRDAKARVGTGLSRLLNLVDGLIGQGLRLLVLITTNERIDKFHPAITRPGRCLAQVDFEPLSVEESNAWLARAGSGLSPPGPLTRSPCTIAELYAKLAGQLSTSESAGLAAFTKSGRAGWIT